MSDNRIQVRCTVCGNTWDEDVEQLKKMQAEIFKSTESVSKYRVTCLKCGTVLVITVREVNDDQVSR